MIIFILGVLSGFSLCCLFSYVGIKNRDDEIEILNKQITKYQDYIDHNMFYDETFVKKGSKDEDTN